jgi:hypothetical protein
MSSSLSSPNKSFPLGFSLLFSGFLKECRSESETDELRRGLFLGRVSSVGDTEELRPTPYCRKSLSVKRFTTMNADLVGVEFRLELELSDFFSTPPLQEPESEFGGVDKAEAASS